jgi:ribonuclease HI
MSAKIYTDGSCLKNPGGASGWAFVILENDEETYLSGGEASSTNNRMEMMAVIKALSFAPGKEYTIFTDSKLVMNCAQGIWKRKANLDLWSEYDYVTSKFSLKWVWVKAHKGNKYNEIVDDMARYEAKKIKK